MNPTLQIQEIARDALAVDPVLKVAGCTVVMQDQADFVRVLEEGLGLADGPVVAIAIDRCENNAPGVVVDWKLYVTERAAVNRERQNYLTAFGAAWRCVEILDGSIHHWAGMEGSLYEEGVFQVSISFKTLLTRTKG
ncbi:MAG: ubiquitin-conjugating enzyme E2 variant [Kiritimatiellia bacterium]